MVDSIPASADVFSLGKVIWSLITGQNVLPYWYFKRDQYNVEKLFPNSRLMAQANKFFEKCIVENESDCLKTGSELLNEIDSILNFVHGGSEFFNLGNPLCHICKQGEYTLFSDRDRLKISDFGLSPNSTGTHKIYVCNSCGHIELFFFLNPGATSLWWSKAKEKLNSLIGESFRIRPKVKRMDPNRGQFIGFEDDKWQLQHDGRQLLNTRTHHILTITREIFLGFRDPDIILLAEPMTLAGDEIWMGKKSHQTTPDYND